MEFNEQPLTLPVENFDFCEGNARRVSRHGELLPNSIRAIFAGPSNTGKTNALLALLTHLNGLILKNPVSATV